MSVPGVLIGFTFHEFAHAWAATLFGDDTPRLQGRLNLSPLAHLDPLGTILLLIGGFGWAKPVQVNVNRLQPRVLGDIVVSLAGVTMNFLLALLFYGLAWMGYQGLLFGYENPVLNQTLERVFLINMALVGFNLIPLPPLDGFHAVKYLFPSHMSHVVEALYRFGPFFLIFLFFSGAAWVILDPIYDALMAAITGIMLPLLFALFPG